MQALCRGRPGSSLAWQLDLAIALTASREERSQVPRTGASRRTHRRAQSHPARECSRCLPGGKRPVGKDVVKGVLARTDQRCPVAKRARSERGSGLCPGAHKAIVVALLDTITRDLQELGGEAAEGDQPGIQSVDQGGGPPAQRKRSVPHSASLRPPARARGKPPPSPGRPSPTGSTRRCPPPPPARW